MLYEMSSQLFMNLHLFDSSLMAFANTLTNKSVEVWIKD
uniref:Uncharacterized protein n=1 Tax=Schistosoma curassoni TaxID=6186 RepID=A0A183KSJ9_9TREM